MSESIAFHILNGNILRAAEESPGRYRLVASTSCFDRRNSSGAGGLVAGKRSQRNRRISRKEFQQILNVIRWLDWFGN
jgi:hypothetical protein